MGYWFSSCNAYAVWHGSWCRKEQAVLSYQIDAVLEKLVLHTEKLEIIQGSQYEILRQIDSLKEE